MLKKTKVQAEASLAGMSDKIKSLFEIH